MNIVMIKKDTNELLESQPCDEKTKEIVLKNIKTNMESAGLSEDDFEVYEMNDIEFSQRNSNYTN